MPWPTASDAGTGLDDSGLERKRRLLAQALARRTAPRTALEWLTEYGGYEIAMLAGAMLAGAARGALILVDGFTVTVAAALAAALDARVLQYCVFGHCSAEHAHRALLEHLGVQPLLDLGMRLGEGSGAARRCPWCRRAAALFTQMATFDGAGGERQGSLSAARLVKWQQPPQPQISARAAHERDAAEQNDHQRVPQRSALYEIPSMRALVKPAIPTGIHTESCHQRSAHRIQIVSGVLRIVRYQSVRRQRDFVIVMRKIVGIARGQKRGHGCGCFRLRAVTQ